MTRVDLGCGAVKQAGFIGIDRYALPGVDIVADLNQPLSLRENSVDLLYASHLTPQLPQWKGVEVLLGTPLAQEIRGRLAFRVCLENGGTIREGEAPFAVKGAMGCWIKLTFSELQHSAGQTFLLTLRLREPCEAQVGLVRSAADASAVDRADGAEAWGPGSARKPVLAVGVCAVSLPLDIPREG